MLTEVALLTTFVLIAVDEQTPSFTVKLTIVLLVGTKNVDAELLPVDQV